MSIKDKIAQFEGEEQFETQAEVETQPEAKAETKSESKAVAPRNEKAGAVAAARPKFNIAFSAEKNVFDTATVEGLSMASPRLKGEQGSVFKGEEELGEVIRIEIVSWNHRWAVGSGENDAEAKDYFRVSYDNETISGTGESLHDYLADLKAQGFNKARISPYLDVFCFITWTSKIGDIDPDNRELCILQCSPVSMGAFTTFCTTRGILESRGLAKPLSEIEVVAERKTKGTNKYTAFSFRAPKK